MLAVINSTNLTDHAKAISLMKIFLKIPGLNLAKAGFVCQLVAGLVGCSAEFLGDVVYYRLEAPQDYNWFWLVEEKNIVENALDNPTEVEDDAIWYESPLFDGPEAMQAEINADDVEIVKIDFSTDTDEYSDKCFAFLNEEKANVGEFLPLGWEAKDDDEQPTEDDTDVEINFGPKLSCPMLFWEGEAKAGIAADWEYA